MTSLTLLVGSFLVLQLIAAQPDLIPSNTQDGHGVEFSSHDSGLPWPITQAHNLDSALIHGSHCLKMVVHLSMNKPDNDLDQFHLEHCIDLLDKITNLNEDELKVTPMVCQDLTGSPDEKGLNYTLDYAADKGVDSEARFGLCYNKLNGSQSPQNVFKMLKNGTQSQDALFWKIMGQNFGTILMKEHTKTPLTNEEKVFVDSWKSPRIVRLAALGLSCSQGTYKIPRQLIKFAMNMNKM